jgi:hypothetical protein
MVSLGDLSYLHQSVSAVALNQLIGYSLSVQMTPVFNVLDLPFSSLCLIETFFMFHRDLPAPVTARSSPILFFSSRYIVSVHKILLRLLSQLGNCSA